MWHFWEILLTGLHPANVDVIIWCCHMLLCHHLMTLLSQAATCHSALNRRWRGEVWARWTRKPTESMLGLGAPCTSCPYSCCFWQWQSGLSLVCKTGGCRFGAMPTQPHRYAAKTSEPLSNPVLMSLYSSTEVSQLVENLIAMFSIFVVNDIGTLLMWMLLCHAHSGISSMVTCSPSVSLDCCAVRCQCLCLVLD